jgi:superfamily II DNA or RNA helicase
MDKTLQDWQKKPIIYMTQECENNDGIFLFHYMGSGKSLTALGIVHNLGLPYLIICPDILVLQWKENYVLPYKKYLPKNINVLSFTDAKAFLKDKPQEFFRTTTLIMDESHNYNKYLSKFSIRKLQKFRKRILLSGTPIYNCFSDIACTINITAGKNVFPVDERKFEKEYYFVQTEKSIIHGWFRNNIIFFRKYLSHYRDLIFLLGFGSTSYSTVRATIPTEKLPKFFQTYSTFIEKFQKFVSSRHNEIIAFYKMFSKLTIKIIGKLVRLNSVTKEIISVMLPVVNGLLLMLFTTVIVYFLNVVYSDANINKGKETYLVPDFKKIGQQIGPYISYYNPYENDKNSSFPKVKETNEYKSLTYKQILVLMRYTVAKMTYEDYVSLGIFKNIETCEQSKYNQKDYNLMLQYGRFIGNICYFQNAKGEDVYELEKILFYDNKNNNCSLLDGIKFSDDIPLKYERILNYKKTFPADRVVIYTSSNRAAKTLSAYLTSVNCSNQLLLNNVSSKKFKAIFKKYYSTESILILDTNYFEGLSILKTNSMFILESVENPSKFAQVRARVVRLDSHSRGSSVKIINLLSTMAIVKRYIGSIQSYLSDSTYVFYPNLYTHYNQSVTPDFILFKKVKLLGSQTAEFIESIRYDSIQFEEPEDNCRGVDCKIGQLTEQSQCGKVISKAILEKK